MGKTKEGWHLLTGIRVDEKRADCSICGPDVRIRVRGGGKRPGCMSLRRQERLRANLRKRYGITVTQWDELVVRQGGRCALCLAPTPDLHVDHCHLSGSVRGLLCRFCNRAISLWGDDLAGAERLAAYMRGDS